MSERPLSTQRERDALDRHITGNYGEDQFKDEPEDMPDYVDNGAVVLHSGGQDSTTCLAWAINMWGRDKVWPVLFDYGQRHVVEMDCAKRICELLEVREPFVLKIHTLRDLATGALTSPAMDVSLDASETSNIFAAEHGLPSTFVPGRNAIFLSLAIAYSGPMGIYNLVTGVCEADRAGYPDCRAEFVRTMEEALSAALDDEDVRIWAPLVKLNKARTFGLAKSLGVLDIVLEESHTCYHGDRSHRFDWGYGCGKCPACNERARGWHQYQEFVHV